MIIEQRLEFDKEVETILALRMFITTIDASTILCNELTFSRIVNYLTVFWDTTLSIPPRSWTAETPQERIMAYQNKIIKIDNSLQNGEFKACWGKEI